MPGVDAREAALALAAANEDENIELWIEGELELPLIFSLQFMISPLGVFAFIFFLCRPWLVHSLIRS